MIIDHQKYIALSTKYPSLEFRSETDTLSYDTITWLNGTYITETEYNLALAEYDALQYQRDRASEYPSLLELTVALYDTDDKSAVEAKRAAVKAKYPKPE
jgi:hypothetical protein